MEHADKLADLAVLILEILAPVVAMMIAFYARKWFQIKLGSEQKKQIDRIVADATSFAEQKLRKMQVDKGGEEDKRLDWAWKFAFSAIEQSGLPKLATMELTDLIEANLGMENKFRENVAAARPPAKKRTPGKPKRK